MRRIFNVALIGHGFMGRAHSNAWRQAPRFFDLPAEVHLRTLCGRDRARTKRAARKLGWEKVETDWRAVLADETIDLVDICTPNDSHCAIALAAARAGKAVLCEKPLALSVVEARRMVAAVKKARVPNMVCHNYRRVPAIALAREMIENGKLGRRLFHFRARYSQDWVVDPKFPLVWRLRSAQAGSGALGDIFSHVVDLARYLVGELREVSGMTETFVRERPLGESAPARTKFSRRKGRVTVDDAVGMMGRFRNGALASIEATRFAPGRKNSILLEINGSGGSLAFDLEDMNRLQYFNLGDRPSEQGFRNIMVTEQAHPYLSHWWPPGHVLGYEHTFVHTVADFVRGICHGRSSLLQPDFADALRTQEVLHAVATSARTRRWIVLS